MADICIVVDVCTLDSRATLVLEECLQRLANLIVLENLESSTSRLSVCYTTWNASDFVYEVELLYARSDGMFNLKEYHTAIKTLSQKRGNANMFKSGTPLAQVLENKHISCLGALLPGETYTHIWSADGAERRIIYVTDQFLEGAESLRSFLQVAADKNTSIDFVHTEHIPDLQQDGESNLQQLHRSLSEAVIAIAEFENCTMERLPVEPEPLDALAKRWLQLLVKSGRLKEQLATLLFPGVLAQATSIIQVSISASLLRLSASMGPVKTCRCHGAVLGSPLPSGSELLCCPVTGQHLDERDCDTESVKIGVDTILHMPPTRDASGSCAQATGRPQKMELQVLKLINLRSLDEVLLFGDPLTVTASSDVEFDPMTGMDPLIWNEKVFLSVCQALQDLDNGLLVRSKYLVDSGEQSPLPVSYLLTSSGEESLLMRRIAGSEEVLPKPSSASTPLPAAAVQEVTKSLKKLEVCDYSPFEHERGIHRKLSEMVNSSVGFRSSGSGTVMRQGYALGNVTGGPSTSNQTLAYPSLWAQPGRSDERPPLHFSGLQLTPRPPMGAASDGFGSGSGSAFRGVSPPRPPGTGFGALPITSGSARGGAGLPPRPRGPNPNQPTGNTFRPGTRFGQPLASQPGTNADAQAGEGRGGSTRGRPVFKRVQGGRIQ